MSWEQVTYVVGTSYICRGNELLKLWERVSNFWERATKLWGRVPNRGNELSSRGNKLVKHDSWLAVSSKTRSHK